MNDAVNLPLDPETAQPHETFSRQDYQVWLDAILGVARHYRLECSAENVRIASMRADDSSVEDVLRQMARQAGLTIKFAHYDPTTLTQWRTPLVVQLKDGQVGIIQVLGDDEQIGIAYSGDLGLQSSIDRQTLLDNALRTVILRPARPVSDVRTNDYIKPYDEHWFRKIVLRDLRPYGHVMLASLVANVLGLGGVLFSMQVYDRVIPAESLPTLYVLFGGVLLAIVFDFIMRIMRMKITDLLGKRADLRVSDLVFGHALRLRNSARPKSTGLVHLAAARAGIAARPDHLQHRHGAGRPAVLPDLPGGVLPDRRAAGADSLVRASLPWWCRGSWPSASWRVWPTSPCASRRCATPCWWKPCRAWTTSRACRPNNASSSSGTTTTPWQRTAACACAP